MLLHDVVDQFCNGSFGNHAAVVHDVNVVPDIEAEVQILLDGKDANWTFVVERLKRTTQFFNTLAGKFLAWAMALVRRFDDYKFLGSAPASAIVAAGYHMKYRVLGKTGWKVSVLGFGAAPLGRTHGDFDEKDGIRAVHAAIDLGVNFIDVAPYYGLTMAEAVLGKALKEIPREKYYLATKVGRYGADEKDFDFSPGRVTRSVDESLKRLRIAHIDLIQCQDIEFTSVPHLVEETIPALQKLKRQGKVRHIGITGLPLKVFRKVLDRAAVDTVHSYCHFCLTNTTLVQLLPFFKEHRSGIINAAPLGMGLLTEKGPPKWHPAPSHIRDVCARAVAHCARRKTSLPQLALQFATSHRDIATTLVGTSSAKKIKESAKCIEQPLDQSLLAEVQDILTPIRNETWPSGRKENN